MEQWHCNGAASRVNANPCMPTPDALPPPFPTPIRLQGEEKKRKKPVLHLDSAAAAAAIALALPLNLFSFLLWPFIQSNILASGCTLIKTVH